MDHIGPSLFVTANSHSSFKSFSKGVSLFTIGMGCLVLGGWALDVTALKSVLPGMANMKSNSALLFILAGIALWMLVNKQTPRIASGLGLIVALAGALTLGEYLFKSDLGIDQVLFRDTTVGAVYAGRMSPATALAFLTIGLALMLLDSPSRNPFNESLAIISSVISGLALVGYSYGISSLYQIGLHSSMALHTALGFFVLSMGIPFARPEQGLMKTILEDTAGGNILRRLLPASVLMSILLGWLSFLGERLELFDDAFGDALTVVSMITALTIFIWIVARQLTAIDLNRQRIHHILQESEAHFGNTLESMMEGCQILGHNWRYLYINSSAENHNRRPNQELMGNIYMEMWPGVEATPMFDALQRCMKERTPQRMVNEFTYPDGARAWFDLSIQPVPDGIFILSSDITKRKQAEQALLEREMKLSILFDILPVGVSILDAEHKVTYSNPALKKILDVSEEELLKGTYQDLKYLKADGTPMPVEEYTSVRAFKEKREIDDAEMGVVKADGSIIWTNVSAAPVDFPDWKLVMVISDITERKHAENEILKLNTELEEKVARRTATLAEANALLQTMMDHIPDHIFFKDMQGRFIRTSRSQAKMLGLSDPTQIIGKTDFDFFPHAQRSFDEEHEVISSGQPLIDIEENVAWPDGHESWFSTTKVPLQDQNGRIIGTFGIGRDITDRKHAEAALQKANEQLHELSIIDDLTGLYNRRGFLLHAEQQLLLAQRAKYSLLVFYADLDGLKQINDQFGHTAGDEAIVAAARILFETFRSSDIKARLGGDEFIVLAMQAEEQDGQILLARLHEKLAQNDQSMSIGVVALNAGDEISMEDIIARADQAMYKEKREKPGRHEP